MIDLEKRKRRKEERDARERDVPHLDQGGFLPRIPLLLDLSHRELGAREQRGEVDRGLCVEGEGAGAETRDARGEGHEDDQLVLQVSIIEMRSESESVCEGRMERGRERREPSLG